MKINMGCGMDYREGYVNCDIEASVRSDMTFDMLKFPWPFDENSSSEILFSHVLEHVPGIMINDRDAFVQIMEECYRILRKNGTIQVIGPHWSMKPTHYLGQPTHYRMIGPWTFQTFDPVLSTQMRYCSSARLKVVRAWTTKREAPFARNLTIGQWGLTTHLRDRVFGRLLNWVPYEGTITVRALK